MIYFQQDQLNSILGFLYWTVEKIADSAVFVTIAILVMQVINNKEETEQTKAQED